MALGSTQPLTEMSTRYIYFWRGKDGRSIELTNLQLSTTICIDIWETYHPKTTLAWLGLYLTGFIAPLESKTLFVLQANNNYVDDAYN